MKHLLIAGALAMLSTNALAYETFQCGDYAIEVDITNSFMVNGSYQNAGTAYLFKNGNPIDNVKLENAMTSVQSPDGPTLQNIRLKDSTFIINRGFIGNSGEFSEGAFILTSYNTGNINCSNKSGHTEL